MNEHQVVDFYGPRYSLDKISFLNTTKNSFSNKYLVTSTSTSTWGPSTSTSVASTVRVQVLKIST